MEILRDPSHARALSLDELRGLLAARGLPNAAETYWRMDIDVEGLMQRSFPEPGSEDVIRRMFDESLDGDRMGLECRRENGRIRFTYSNVILTASIPA